MAKKQRNTRPTFKRNVAQSTQNLGKIPIWGWFAGIAVLAVLLVAGLFYLGLQGAAIANSGIEGVEIFADPGQGHQSGDLTYTQDAPVGGVHNPEWLHCGIYNEPVRLENVIHSMEHGAVWIAYQPDLPGGQVETLRNLVRAEQSRQGERLIVLAPKLDLEDPIVATAWRVQLRLNDASDERLLQFVQRYQRGPFTPELGANCTFGGVGEPLS